MDTTQIIDTCKRTCEAIGLVCTENENGISVNARKNSAEGTHRLNFRAVKDCGEIYFTITGQQINYYGKDTRIAMEKLEAAKILFDS